MKSWRKNLLKYYVTLTFASSLRNTLRFVPSLTEPKETSHARMRHLLTQINISYYVRTKEILKKNHIEGKCLKKRLEMSLKRFEKRIEEIFFKKTSWNVFKRLEEKYLKNPLLNCVEAFWKMSKKNVLKTSWRKLT